MTEPPTSRGTVLITGGNCGLGLHAAKALHLEGFDIIITARDEEKGKAAVEAIGPRAKYLKLDLCSVDSIEDFTKELMDCVDHLHSVICNAGIMNAPMKLSQDGVEMHFQTNHLGHFYLINGIRSLVEGGRIVVITSGFYKKALELPTIDQLTGDMFPLMTPKEAYSASKLANVLFVRALDARLKASGSTTKVVAVRPGFVRGTELGRFTNVIFRFLAAPLIRLVSIDLDQGIRGYLHCVTASDIESGALYHCDNIEPYGDIISDQNAEELWKLSEELIRRIQNE
uniref:SDR family NAD(P)-dependent oxidoreductase n=1 Tax=Steinernema glaseri TaxID=37863 RepID=A0A1I7ZWJ8_9BILA